MGDCQILIVSMTTHQPQSFHKVKCHMLAFRFPNMAWMMASAVHLYVSECVVFPRYWPSVWRIHRSSVNSLHKGQWRGALVFKTLICVWVNAWVNNREAGDLKRHIAHYDATVMSYVHNCCPSECVKRLLQLYTIASVNVCCDCFSYAHLA